MSEGPPTIPAAPSTPRPVLVPLAVGAMLLAVLALVGYSVPAMLYTEPVLDVYREAYAGTIAEADTNQLSATSFHVFGAVLLALAAALAGLAPLVYLGKRPARVLLWLLVPMVVCAGIPTLLLVPDPPPRPPGAPSAAELEQLLSEAVPAWVDPVSLASALVMVLALVLAAALLSLPRANDYFRKPPEFVPPPPPLNSG